MPARTAADMPPTLWKQYRPFRCIADNRPTSEYIERVNVVAAAIAKELKAQFGASRVMLFGSLAKGDFHKWSDIDLAVWGVSSEYYRAVAFASGFSDLFKVDLVDADDCSESLRQNILREGVEL